MPGIPIQPSAHRPLPPLRFGASRKQKLARYEAGLPGHLARLHPQDQAEPQDIFRKVVRETTHPATEIVTKQPGQNVWFSVRNPLAMVNRFDPTSGKEKPQGLFNNDMQHLDHFLIKAPRNGKLVAEKFTDLTAPDRAGFEIEYAVEGQPHLGITRRQTIDPQGTLHEELTFHNRGQSAASFDVEMGSQARDIFQARSPGAKKLYTHIRHGIRQDGNDIELEARHFPQNEDARHPGQEVNTIRTRFTPLGDFQSFQPVAGSEHTMLNLRVSVPPGGTVRSGVTISTASDRFGQALYMPEIYRKTWDSLETALDVEATDRAMRHLPRMWQTSFKDLRALTIPVQCGSATFFPAAAGIPNFLALFGRDSLITALQTLQMNSMLARDTLAALAYYQGKKNDPFTEEEPGKILHELRLGETTRLGISPHKPYYGTIDATPLFAILFDEYFKRTSDPTLMRVLWPNFEAALHWIDSHIIDDPANPLYGFLAQRDITTTDEKNVRGAQGLKNIGWKDSDGSTRHLAEDRHGNILDKGADGCIRDRHNRVLVDEKGQLTDAGKKAGLKLTYAKYPLALAEVQAYVYGAWQAAENMYARQAEASAKPHEREALMQQSRAYGRKAQALRQRFNEKFWMPHENFIAMALQSDGRQLTSVTSNGAQALMTGIVDDDKAAKMARRLMQPDMASGWGIRTLSAYSFAYDPFAYHNGTIWPHDNALIVKGLARYGFKDTASALGSQVLRAGGKFRNGRLPELYTGMPREKGDRSIPVYPNTCIPQAWAAGTAPLIVSSLLGLRVDEAARAIYLDHPVLPEGVRAMKLTLGVRPATLPRYSEGDARDIEHLNRPQADADGMLPGEQATLLIERQGDRSVRVTKIAGSPHIQVHVNAGQHFPQAG